MRTRMNFKFIDMNEQKMTEYQKLVFYYFLGRLSLEDDGTVGENLQVEVYESNEFGFKNKAMVVRFYGLNYRLLEDYLRDFPFKEDTQLVGNHTSQGYAGIYVHARTITQRTESYNKITFDKSIAL